MCGLSAEDLRNCWGFADETQLYFVHMQAEGSRQPLRPTSRTYPRALSRPWAPCDDAGRMSHGQRGTKGLLYLPGHAVDERGPAWFVGPGGFSDLGVPERSPTIC